jgi:hypothetical protein
MTEFNEPVLSTLSDRLREAAVLRADKRGDIVDDVVLEDDGAIDLTVVDRVVPGATTTQTPAALVAVRGNVPPADMSDLYTSVDDVDRRWWRRGRSTPTSPSTTEATSAAPTLSGLPPAVEHESETVLGPDVDLEVILVTPPVEAEPDIDLRDTVADDEARPTAACPECGRDGERDLYDVVSRTAYFSCDDCLQFWQVVTD